jgi:hypothetical protein
MSRFKETLICRFIKMHYLCLVKFELITALVSERILCYTNPR